MLAIALLLIGAAVAAWLAVPDYGSGQLLQGSLAAIAVAAAQIGVAAALFWRVPGAWLVAIATFGVHLVVMALAALFLLVFEVFPYQGNEFFGGNEEFNPLALAAIVVGGFGCAVLYSLAILSARERGTGHAGSPLTSALAPQRSPSDTAPQSARRPTE